jgi:integrating conjugative element relaxase (TIGR03760 family)
LAPAVFERDLLPALHRYAEFVQLMPASESHHHANAGGLLAHTLETLLYAMTFRNGYLLPRGAGAEVIDAERDFWTYAVFLGALLHDVGKPIADLRIQMRRPKLSDAVIWVPLAGSLVDCGAYEYHVAFTPKSQRDYTAHSRLGMTLMQRLVPATTLAFLARTPSVLLELNHYLVGDARDGVINDIVRRADQESTRRNLGSGSRARFATANSVPLIEQLMLAIRTMLKQGTYLPLNRDGSAGWVYGDSIWFVAKRLADGVRDFIKKHAAEDADGIPGETKNDRLFDTWQEYGCIMPNPDTGQAIWYAVVQGHDATGQVAYRHRLSMLRFPLAKVWDSADHYPPPMNGAIIMVAKEGKANGGESDAGEQFEQSLAPGDGAPNGENTTPKSSDNKTSHAPQAPEMSEAAPREKAASVVNPTPLDKSEGRKVPVPKFAQPGAMRTTGHADRRDVDPDDFLDDADCAKAEATAIKREREVKQRAKAMPHHPQTEATQASEAASTATAAKESLPPVSPGPAISSEAAAMKQSATTPVLNQSPRHSIPAETMALPTVEPHAGPVSRPVVLPSAAPPSPPPGSAKSKEPSLLAIRFMTWLQTGLADGSIKHNELGAPVHFVEQGMALVSPLIFKEYAMRFGESLTGDEESSPEPVTGTPGEASRLGLVVQREVIRAQWHQQAPGGMNVWAFQVKRRGTGRASRLSAVVLRDPQRWVMPVPPPNPYIMPATAEVESDKQHSSSP